MYSLSSLSQTFLPEGFFTSHISPVDLTDSVSWNSNTQQSARSLKAPPISHLHQILYGCWHHSFSYRYRLLWQIESSFSCLLGEHQQAAELLEQASRTISFLFPEHCLTSAAGTPYLVFAGFRKLLVQYSSSQSTASPQALQWKPASCSLIFASFFVSITGILAVTNRCSLETGMYPVSVSSNSRKDDDEDCVNGMTWLLTLLPEIPGGCNIKSLFNSERLTVIVSRGVNHCACSMYKQLRKVERD